MAPICGHKYTTTINKSLNCSSDHAQTWNANLARKLGQEISLIKLTRFLTITHKCQSSQPKKFSSVAKLKLSFLVWCKFICGHFFQGKFFADFQFVTGTQQ